LALQLRIAPTRRSIATANGGSDGRLPKFGEGHGLDERQSMI
jgi:hypothetical protein